MLLGRMFWTDNAYHSSTIYMFATLLGSTNIAEDIGIHIIKGNGTLIILSTQWQSDIHQIFLLRLVVKIKIVKLARREYDYILTQITLTEET
jgi:hypothetical protein